MRKAIFFILACAAAATVAAQTPPAAPPQAAANIVVRNTTRVEGWSFFEPRAGGDPTYADVENRLFAEVRAVRPRWEIAGAVQFVQLGWLPTNSIGPGPLGAGASYYEHNQRTDSRQLYVRELYARAKKLPGGFDVRGGRMSYASGAELASGDAAIEAVKRLRLDSRLAGDFEWSMYQRAWDGARVDWDRSVNHATVATLWPTQGGFDEHANANMRDVRLVALTYGLRPSSSWTEHAELQAFAYDYRDTRPVSARPDNSGLKATSVDVHLPTFGTSVVSSIPVDGASRADLLGWFAVQRGTWYGQGQQAWAAAVEAGFRWTKAPWAPWLRGGWNRASGDDDPHDATHGTFVPLLPTSRKYSLSTAYTFMNLDDRFVQAVLKPAARVTLRADVHRLVLASGADRWYSGSGATRREGTIFGYAGRVTGGASDLGTILEAAPDVTVTPHWSINGYAGRMWGRDAVRFLFARDRLVFAYVENVIQF